MAATLRFTATGSDKYIKVTDKLNSAAKAEVKFQKVTGDVPFEVTVSTQGTPGVNDVRVDISRDNATYGNYHDGTLAEGAAIDDSKLPAAVTFTSAKTPKYLRITDKNSGSENVSKLLNDGEKFEINVLAVKNSGEVKVEVSRDNSTYATHDDRMPVTHGSTYPIDDAKLPKQAARR